MEITKYFRLLARLLVAFYKLMGKQRKSPWTWRSQVSAFREPSPLWARVFATGRFFVCYQKRTIITNLATNLWMDNGVLPARYNRAMMTQILWKYTKHICFGTRTSSWDRTHSSNIAAWPRTWDLIVKGPDMKPNTTLIKKPNHSNKITPNLICYTPKSVPCSAIIRKVFFFFLQKM